VAADVDVHERRAAMHVNLGSILRASAVSSADRVAIRMGDRAISYAELDRAASGIAASLRARGLAPGDKIAMLVPNVPEFTMAYFGILYAGCTVVPINVLLSGQEIHYHLEDSESKLLVAHSFFRATVEQGAGAAGVPVVWTEGEGDEVIPAMAQADPLGAIHPASAVDTAVILYTSGTTGKPKGAELTHVNLLLNCAVVTPRLIPLQRDDVALATLPFFHSFGQTCVQNASISMGGSFTLLPRFDPAEAFAIMERDRVTTVAGVPTMYFALLHHEAEREYDISSLRWCLSGGAPMPVEVMKAFEAKYPVKILEGYGLSETSPVASFNDINLPRKPGSIGYPVWGVDMQVLDQNDQPVPDGEPGEICIRGHNVMKGYLNQPEATKEALRGGWFHSGDIGVRDDEGAFTIVDRKKDMILRGGFNVYPREVEEVLYGHEAIVEAAVIGVSDARFGEEVKAVVVSSDPKLTAQDLIDYTKQHLAAYKYPRSVEFVESLPKGPTGKILKRELRRA
jgi:long-chain acyl-CoA synthetase